MNYRSEVDGLRALAVVSVILFHAGFEIFGGGYVGVDVFFVISGYLITTIIIDELNTGVFSIVNFYERRARRILPALFLIMAVCIPFAWFLLLPDDMKDFSLSLAMVTIFASNILFWLQSGYFDTAAELKPLLHTWSLAVEEQFYLIFPFFLLMAWRFGKKWIILILTLVALSSLFMAERSAPTQSAAAFYLLPTRGWELAIGSFVAFILSDKGNSEFKPGVSQLLSVLGLALILYSIFAYNESTPFPGLYALVPTIGTTLILIFACPQTAVGKVLGSKPFVAIGLLSYSAYLWHQPLFAFARHWSFEKPGLITFGLLFFVTFVLAYLTWRYVERPLRKITFSRKVVFTSSLIISTIFFVIGYIAFENNGIERRFDYVVNNADGYEFNNKKLQSESWRFLRKMYNDNDYGVENNPADQKVTFFDDSNKIKVLIIGNSHSKDLFNLLFLNMESFPNFQFGRFGIQISCIDGGSRFFQSSNYKASQVILISTQWRDTGCKDSPGSKSDFQGLERLVQRATIDRKLVVITTNALEFPSSSNMTVADREVFQVMARLKRPLSDGEKGDIANKLSARYFDFKDSDKKVARVNSKLRKLAQKYDLILLEKEDYFCDKTRKACLSLTSGFKKVLFDYGHYTLDGAKELGMIASAINWLKPVENSLAFDDASHRAKCGVESYPRRAPGLPTHDACPPGSETSAMPLPLLNVAPPAVLTAESYACHESFFPIPLPSTPHLLARSGPRRISP
ncbi:MAG: acyltransferase [Chromatiaceae bacterium]|nr:acyltransferase [Chromatiaceae bacterium]MBP6260804.1 acyltransferase [Chromatiaceae bacterium]MBP8023790.1 acyltransferase [Chromatiaceae bacterium]MBP9602474.1 acyltransferase [Chromatiaceae bacterium]